MSAFLKLFDLTETDFWMILLTIPLFVLLWKLLDVYLFGPYLRLVEAREGATSGALEQAEKDSKIAEKIEHDYQEALTTARVDAMTEKLQVLNKAKAEVARIFDSAETQAEEEVRKVRWDLAQSLASLREETMKESEVLAQDLIGRIERPN